MKIVGMIVIVIYGRQCRLQLDCWSCARGCYRQQDDELSPFSMITRNAVLCPDAAVIVLDKASHQVESESGTACFRSTS